MKKVLFGIFAHPDDEAFGPSGTLLKLRGEGCDIHLILLTDGDAGKNVDNVSDLAATRLKEWQASADMLGAHSTHALHYPDGALEEVSEEETNAKVSHIITEVIKGYSEHLELSFMTFEPHGLTGHRDHVAASELTTKVAARFNAREIWYFCLDSTQAPLENTAYYEPRAREDNYITTKVDVAHWLQTKYQIMDAHTSQRNDAANIKTLDLSTENFHVDTFSFGPES